MAGPVGPHAAIRLFDRVGYEVIRAHDEALVTRGLERLRAVPRLHLLDPTQPITARADYNFSPDVSWANLIQYDNESRVAGLQSRFRWILRPGNDLFLVLNRGWVRSLDDNRFEPSFDRGCAKLQYTFRF